ncbi:hypothetical protein [Methylobacter sp. YRD-M1]|uniref:hypothetical protein n=1 Tax=Methylobacter sp. YRD-M1 TaxID=2911520 RepID=UPI00227ABC32|nr:hypothetical protein [Methylobacter sp. YRD-M1]WAK03305.1 hypothetical protein LZ558_05860 [Methylobacter sp. YRD-M1]
MGLQTGGHQPLAAGIGTFGYETNVNYLLGFPRSIKLKDLREEFRNNDYRYVAISPPAVLDLPSVYERDWGIDFDYIRGNARSE